MAVRGSRQLARLPRHLPDNIDLRAISLVEGVRAGLAASVPVAASVAFNQPELSRAALGALLTCIVDPAGPLRRRMPVLGAFIVVGAIFIGGFGLVRATGIAPTIAVALPALFACAYLRVWGQPAQALGNLLGVVMLLGTDSPLDFPHALKTAGIFAAGGLWAFLLTVAIWRVHPYGPARRAVADVWSALATLTRQLRTACAPDAPERAWEVEASRRGSVRESIERARAVLMDTLEARGPASGPAAQNLLRLEAADRVFAVVVALAGVLETADAASRSAALPMLRRMGGLLALLSHATEREMLPRGARIERTLGTICAEGCQPSEVQPLARLFADRVRLATKYVDPAQYLPGSGVQGDAGVPWRDRVLAPLRSNLTWRSASLRHAVRIGVVVPAALAATLIWHGAYTHWVTITLVLVMQPFFAVTRERVLQRVAGSVFGGSVALLLSLLVRTRAHVAGLLPVLGALALAVRQVNYGVYIAVYTPTVILLVENTHPGGAFWHVALWRGGFTLLGGLVAVAANVLLWPSWEPNRVRDDLRAALAAHAAFAAVVLNPCPGQDEDQARRAVGLASNNLEASIARAMQEPRRPAQRDRMQAALVADAALRRIAGRLVAISLGGGRDGPAARWVVAALAALVANQPPPPRPAAGGGVMLDRLARQVDTLPDILTRAGYAQ